MSEGRRGRAGLGGIGPGRAGIPAQLHPRGLAEFPSTACFPRALGLPAAAGAGISFSRALFVTGSSLKSASSVKETVENPRLRSGCSVRAVLGWFVFVNFVFEQVRQEQARGPPQGEAAASAHGCEPGAAGRARPSGAPGAPP